MKARMFVLASATALIACATARAVNVPLNEAKALYQGLQERGAEQRIDADMERAKAAIDRADSASAEGQGTDYVNAVGDIALQLTQAATAKEAAIVARRAADSLRAARLTRLLNLSEAQRAQLLAQNQISAEEVAFLQQRTRALVQGQDSLQMQLEQERSRSDSLSRVADQELANADTIARGAARESRVQTLAEQSRSDSLRRLAQSARQQSDSLKRVLEQSQRMSARAQDSTRVSTGEVAGAQTQEIRVARQRGDSLAQAANQAERQLDSARRASDQGTRERDSLRVAADAASRRADSLRATAEAATQARDSLRALNASLSELRGTMAGLRELRETERGLVISLSGVLFDPGRSTLKPGAVRSVERIAHVLQRYPSYQLVAEGHTDSTGSADRNQTLSEQRAEAVKAALVSGGVEASRVSARGFGSGQPVATNVTPTGRQQNRRVEIVVEASGASAAPP